MATTRRNRPTSGEPFDVRAVFSTRTHALVERLASQVSDETLAAALASPTDIGGLARLLSDAVALEVDLERIDPMAEAVARGVDAKEQLLREAGGGMGSVVAAKHLGITRQGVEKRRRAGKLLALQTGGGNYLYPLCQFTEDGVVPGLDRFLGALPPSGGWTRLDALLTPAEEIGGRSPLQALREGDVDAAVLAASMFAEQG